MVPLIPFPGIVAIKEESSDVYLKKVIQELQTFNGPGSHHPNGVLSNSLPSVSFPISENNEVFNYNYWKTAPYHYQYDYSQYPSNQINIEKIDRDFVGLDSKNQFVSRPQAIGKPWRGDASGTFGLTNIHLAAMYENALQKGAPVGLVPLTTALSSGKSPKVTSTHLEIPSAQSQYSYYFFPLKSFGNELRNNYGYKTIPDNIKEGTELMETQKEMANPLFVAVSGFIGMALLFMVGVLLFPKIRAFVPREQQDDLLQLAKIVTKAIHRNPLMGRSRKSFTNWSFRKRNIY